MRLSLPKIPMWPSLRPIGNSWATRLTILIPIFGYLIIFNAALAHYAALIVELGGRLPEQFNLSVPPRLFQVYFGLCFVAVGSAIYSYWCPKIIKRYASASEFAGGDGAHIGEYARGLIEIRIQKSPRRSEYIEFCDRMINRIDSEYSREQATEEMSNALYQRPRILTH
jgi:hypothetical protein